VEETVILVDQSGNAWSVKEKMKAHEEGDLHRAFSIFIFNGKGELLLQKRAASKYHSAGLWSNTCCSHPRPGETTKEAARRRLFEEMGLDCDIEEIFASIYRADFNHLTEHEYDHVFIGLHDGPPLLNETEAEAWKWVGIEDLRRDLRLRPERYTYWLRILMNEVCRRTRRGLDE
jgi:isopentenyl-diphosphate delta-isomerase